MNAAATILTIILGGGSLAGLAALIKVRAERGNVVMSTVEKGVVVLERLNDRLERQKEELEKENDNLWARVRFLEHHCRAQGIVVPSWPVPTPPEKNPSGF